MQREQADVVVIGAGVVGLAVARQLSMAGRSVIVLERHGHFGEENSSRNSEVIHAGIYYPAGSLKARLCVRGKQLLYAYCEALHVPHRRCGKIVVAASPDQADVLDALRQKALANGVGDLEPIGPQAIRRLEPEIRGVAALLSPSTGIVDSHGLMTAFLAQAEDHGAMLVCRSAVRGGQIGPSGAELVVDSGGEELLLTCRLAINSAGLHAGRLADRIDGLDAAARRRIHFARGHYFVPAGRSPRFERLIYPVPERGGLGVHVTIDLGGQVRFGPNIEWLDGDSEEPPFEVDPALACSFEDAVARYWPGVRDAGLRPGFAGIRPKLAAAGAPDADFVIQGPEETGTPHWINLYGIESPGLTASLAIGEIVGELARASA